MNGTSRSNGSDTRGEVLVLHRQHDQWRLLSAALVNDAVTVLAAESVSATNTHDLLQRLHDDPADRVVVVLPGGSVVCRPLNLPGMEPEALAAAIDLQAETMLPANLPRHRWSATALPWNSADGSSLAVAVGWPGAAERLNLPDFESGGEHFESFDPTFVAESSCLLELLAANAGRGFAAYADRNNGSIEFVMHEDGPTLIRTARLGVTDWAPTAGRIVMETGLGAGLDDQEVEPLVAQVEKQCTARAQTLVLSSDLRTAAAAKIQGAEEYDQWWSHYGVAAGAALAALGPRRSMTALRLEAPLQPRNPLIKIAEWMATPRRTAAVIIVSLLILIGAPLASAWTRVKLLERKTAGLTEVRADANELERRAYFYELLRKHRWPMTKLLADISGAAPYEVEFTEITLVRANEKVVIKGTAQGGEDDAVATLVRNLSGDVNPIFGAADVLSREPVGSRVDFEVSAEIRSPTVQVPRPFDEPRVAVLYGEEALQAAEERAAAGDPPLFGSDDSGMTGLFENTEPSVGLFGDPDTDTPLFGSSGDEGDSTRSSRSNRSVPRDDGTIPPPLTEEEISQLTRPQATDETVKRIRLMGNKDLAPDVRERLNREKTLLIQHSTRLKAKAEAEQGGDN